MIDQSTHHHHEKKTQGKKEEVVLSRTGGGWNSGFRSGVLLTGSREKIGGSKKEASTVALQTSFRDFSVYASTWLLPTFRFFRMANSLHDKYVSRN